MENFKVSEPWQQKLKDAAIQYLSENYGRWFAALGAVGSGKTHICTAICGQLINAGLEVKYMRWREDGTKIKALVSNPEEYAKCMEPLKRARVLYIDDLFKGKVGADISNGDINLAFELLDYRYCDPSMLTIISSEKTRNELLNIDEGVGSRIYERTGEEYSICLTGDKNQRIRGVRQ